jgi:hypothetical protein
MCNPASFIITKGPKIWWSEKSDKHEDIISEHKLHADGIGGPNIVRVEINPSNGNLSLPLKDWKYQVDQDVFPPWYDEAVCKRECFVELKHWADKKLIGWKVFEAFQPFHPLKIDPIPLSKRRLLALLKKWDSVRASVGDSVRDSVWASVGDSVWASVGDSVWAYISSFIAIKYVYDFSSAVRLWEEGLVPSYDEKTWRLHGGKSAKVLYEWTPGGRKEEVHDA